MLFSENIYFLILFTLPAALNVIYNAHIRHTPVVKQDKSVELAECVVFCFAVFLVNIFVLHEQMGLFAQYSLLDKKEVDSFCRLTGFNYIKFVIRYFVWNIISSLAVLTIWYTIGQWLFRKIRNILNKLRKRPEELKFLDVWSNIFETNQYVDIVNSIVKIEKNGVLVTAGVLSIYSPPNSQNKEFLLCDVDLVKQLFEDDEKLPLEYRMFKNSNYEYYNIQDDVLIKFYSNELYVKIYERKE